MGHSGTHRDGASGAPELCGFPGRQSSSGLTLPSLLVPHPGGPPHLLLQLQSPQLVSSPWEQTTSSLLPFFFFKNIFYTICKGCSPFTVITEYWLFSCVVEHTLEPILHPLVCVSISHPCIAPPLPPLVTTSLFSGSVRLLLFSLYSLVCCIFLDFTCDIMQYLSFSI